MSGAKRGLPSTGGGLSNDGCMIVVNGIDLESVFTLHAKYSSLASTNETIIFGCIVLHRRTNEARGKPAGSWMKDE